jgi:16S rRNA (uracil1498-N3)-methyltransferase
VFVASATALAAASVGSLVRLDGPEGRHAVSVRRMGPGEAVDLVDGLGRRVTGRVSSVVDKQTLDIAVDGIDDEPDPQPRVVVVQALPKGDRGELAVELLTEIGVDVIIPWSAANCVTQWKAERVGRSHQRWSDAAHAAGKQARRARFPEVESLASTSDVVARVADAATALVLHEDAPASIASAAVPADGELLLIIGPEGGLTPGERDAFAAAGAAEVRLGPSVLRTSSAGIAAVAALMAPSLRWAVPGSPGDGRMTP